jgi:molybdate transport system ATP-binding protein
VIRLTFDVRLAQGEFTLDVADDAEVEVLGVFGPSGSGKTSLLEVIAGLRVASRGVVSVGGQVLEDTSRGIHLPPHRRHIGYVPQDGALFPHLDVRQNVVYGADSRAETADARLDPANIASTLDISTLLGRRVRDLSGGERQRVAIARALVSSPRILLLDEPLTGIDRSRKDRILPYLLRIRRELHVPMIYVTHDAREMVDIADRVIRLEAGGVAGVGAPGVALDRSGDAAAGAGL